MRVVLVLVLIALAGAGGYGYYDQTKKLKETQRRLAEAEAVIVADRNTLRAVCNEYASAPKVHRALDTLQGQINGVRGDVGRINTDYASARKVDTNLTDVRGEIAGLKRGLAEARKPAPPLPAPPTHVVELGFRTGPDTVVVLRYAGASVADALGRKTLTSPGPTLAAAVKVAPGDPKAGTAAFNYAVVRSPEATRTVSLGGAKPPVIGVVRSAPDGADWGLSADGRKELADLLRSGEGR